MKLELLIECQGLGSGTSLDVDIGQLANFRLFLNLFLTCLRGEHFMRLQFVDAGGIEFAEDGCSVSMRWRHHSHPSGCSLLAPRSPSDSGAHHLDSFMHTILSERIWKLEASCSSSLPMFNYSPTFLRRADRGGKEPYRWAAS